MSVLKSISKLIRDLTVWSEKMKGLEENKEDIGMGKKF